MKRPSPIEEEIRRLVEERVKNLNRESQKPGESVVGPLSPQLRRAYARKLVISEKMHTFTDLLRKHGPNLETMSDREIAAVSPEYVQWRSKLGEEKRKNKSFWLDVRQSLRINLVDEIAIRGDGMVVRILGGTGSIIQQLRPLN